MASKKETVTQIARDLNLKDSVVEAVVDRFIDLSVEEVVQTGKLRIPFLLTITSADYKAYKNAMGSTPAHKRLKVGLSDGLRKLFKHQQNNPHGVTVTRDNWRNIISELHREKDNKVRVGDPEDWNPLLDEDD